LAIPRIEGIPHNYTDMISQNLMEIEQCRIYSARMNNQGGPINTIITQELFPRMDSPVGYSNNVAIESDQYPLSS